MPLGASLTVAQQASILAKYTGGKVGTASETPIQIGWVNTDTGLSAFPVMTQGVKAAVAFANAHLDGIDGHPIDLVTCSIATEEDGQSCGATYLNNPNINLILEGVLIQGSDTFYKAINNTKTIIQLSANSPSDLNPYPGNTHPNVFTLSAGAVGTYFAMINYAVKYGHVKKMLLLSLNDPNARAGVAEFAGALKSDGVATKSVFITPGAGASQVAADIQGAGGSGYDGWYISSDEQTCVNIVQYATQSGLKPLIVGEQCNGPIFKSTTGNYAPKDVVFPDLDWSVWLPQESQLQDAINYAASEEIPNGTDPESEAIGFYNVLDAVRAMNTTPTSLTTDSIASAIRGLKAPILGNGGGFDCGGMSALPTICGDSVGMVEFNGTKYVRLAPTSSVPLFKIWTFQS